MKMKVKDSQGISLNILRIVTNICEKQNLNYYLMYGTLIGAVRHHGFIPWDDDIDIMMPRKDYDVLIKFLKENPSELHGMEIFNPDFCKDYPYMITRISNPNYKIEMDNEYPYGMGIFIDIYPFDGVGDKLSDALKIEHKGDILSSLCYLATRKHFSKENTKGVAKILVKFPAFILAKFLGKDFFQNRLSGLSNKNFYSSKYVCCVTWASGGKKDIYERKWFDRYTYMNFENYRFRVPLDYNNVLKHTYGDYMKLPPVKERMGHHFYNVSI